MTGWKRKGLREGFVSIERYAKWVGLPVSKIRQKIDFGNLNGFVLRGKEYIKLAKYRIEFYRERERRCQTGAK